ncbi:hypothetical protein EDC01DRAFT_641175 [Geopyxis carbonaria]|nr:hypothetical protein EDC01DRAFT_641175 [Geopyxis carbonaria]
MFELVLMWYKSVKPLARHRSICSRIMTKNLLTLLRLLASEFIKFLRYTSLVEVTLQYLKMSASAPNSVKISLPLGFQKELFQEIRTDDRLVVLARGLGLLRIVVNLLHSFDAAGDNLVILVGANEKEIDWIGQTLAEQSVISRCLKAKGLSVVNTDNMSITVRQRLYAKGGIFAITSRILVVDLLTNLLIPETISGIVVLHAERVIATSLEAFILRIYRQKNSTGFIKGFSDNPEAFSSGFSPLSTMLKNLHLRTPSLWPRFHLSVAESLDDKKAEVIELSVSMTASMHSIQNAILQAIEVTLSEIKKGNSRELDMEDWDVESALHKSFDVLIKRQLDPMWHRVSWRTKQLVGDLTTLRKMLNDLVSYDSVTFYSYLESILAAQSSTGGSARQTQSPWLFLDAAQVILTTAKNRAYVGRVSMNGHSDLVPVLEEQPKWEMLTKILDEIARDIHFNPVSSDDSYGTILIMCSDDRDDKVCKQLREYLQSLGNEPQGLNDENHSDKIHGTYFMRRNLRRYLAWKRGLPQLKAALAIESSKPANSVEAQKTNQEWFRGQAPHSKRRRVRGGGSGGGRGTNFSGPTRSTGGIMEISEETNSHIAGLMAGIQSSVEEIHLNQDIGTDPLEDVDNYYQSYKLQDLVVVHPFSGDVDDQLLEELRPKYIIMYNPDTAFVRRVEVYRSSHTNRKIKVYFLYYGDSVEEQRFLSAVRKEKDSFSKIIREKGTMVVTLTDGHGVVDPQEEFLRTVNTRIAGSGKLTATSGPPRVVVDIREFRSSLPSLLHGRNMTVVPCMLTVGDYIITPDICVERKSISDLISSFKDGRLYTQCESMLQHYKQPMVLIEFDQNKSFNLEPFLDLGGNIGHNDLQSKLVLLSLTFPKIKFIWSSSPYQTAEIFEDLKNDKEEPDPVKAPKVGLEEGDDYMQMYNQISQDMLRAIPGINLKNYRSVMSNVENMVQLSNMSEKEIGHIIGPEAGKKTHRFLNRNLYTS